MTILVDKETKDKVLRLFMKNHNVGGPGFPHVKEGSIRVGDDVTLNSYLWVTYDQDNGATVETVSIGYDIERLDE